MKNKSSCTICHIILKTETAYIIFENNNYIAFLDKHPLFPGHSLLCPKNHICTIYELSKGFITSYFILIQQLSKAIEISTQSTGSFIAINNIVSQSIPHLHTHLVPRKEGDGLKGFFWPRQKYKNEEEMRKIQKRISHNLQIIQNEKS